MVQNAHARAADPGAAVISLDETITAEDSATTCAGQATVLTADTDARRADAVRIIGLTSGHVGDLAAVLGVSRSTAQRWRCGAVAPQPRHWRRLQALWGLLP